MAFYKEKVGPEWIDLYELETSSTRFKIGDIVEAFITDNSPSWLFDWQRTDLQVIGICWDHRKREWDVTCLHDGDQITDGFRLENLWKKITQYT